MRLLVVLAVILSLVGLLLLMIAFQCVASKNTKVVYRGQLLGGLSSGLLTGAVVTVGVLLLQQYLADLSADALWRTSVETAADIPGFTPSGHSLQGLDLSGKQLPDAELRGVNLMGVQLRDTDLTDADLTNADLHDVVMYSADLSGAVLTGADLSGAQLQGVNFSYAAVDNVGSFIGAVADAGTCWPRGFLEHPIAKEIKPTPVNDQGNIKISRGHEYPGCLKIP